jgi:ubiquinone/menaquinone biosynthesis C-methylase UbiE
VKDSHHSDLIEFYKILLSDERKKWQNPQLILRQFGDLKGKRLLEVACGPGYFLSHAATLVGPQGFVLGIDSQPLAIEISRERLEAVGFSNYRLVIKDAMETPWHLGTFDFILIANALHDFGDANIVLRNVSESLEPDGKVMIVDWKKTHTKFGPPVEKRLSKKQAEAIMLQAGFSKTSSYERLPYHYLLVWKKNIR